MSPVAPHRGNRRGERDPRVPGYGKQSLICICLAALIPGVRAGAQGEPGKEDAGSLLRKALETTRASPSLRSHYTFKIQVPGQKPVEIHGTALIVGDLVFIEYRGTADQVKFIVRKGDRVLQWHFTAELWVDSRKDMGDRGAGRGLQNPNEVLDLIASHSKDAVAARETAEERTVSLTLGGETLRPLLRFDLREEEVDWSRTEVKGELDVRKADGWISRIRCSAALPTRDQVTRFEGSVTLAPSEETEHKFFDVGPDGKPKEVPLDDAVREKLGLPPKKK